MHSRLNRIFLGFNFVTVQHHIEGFRQLQLGWDAALLVILPPPPAGLTSRVPKNAAGTRAAIAIMARTALILTRDGIYASNGSNHEHGWFEELHDPEMRSTRVSNTIPRRCRTTDVVFQ